MEIKSFYISSGPNRVLVIQKIDKLIAIEYRFAIAVGTQQIIITKSRIAKISRNAWKGKPKFGMTNHSRICFVTLPYIFHGVQTQILGGTPKGAATKKDKV